MHSIIIITPLDLDIPWIKFASYFHLSVWISVGQCNLVLISLPQNNVILVLSQIIIGVEKNNRNLKIEKLVPRIDSNTSVISKCESIYVYSVKFELTSKKCNLSDNTDTLSKSLSEEDGEKLIRVFNVFIPTPKRQEAYALFSLHRLFRM
jgi:hypothetical protein